MEDYTWIVSQHIYSVSNNEPHHTVWPGWIVSLGLVLGLILYCNFGVLLRI